MTTPPMPSTAPLLEGRGPPRPLARAPREAAVAPAFLRQRQGTVSAPAPCVAGHLARPPPAPAARRGPAAPARSRSRPPARSRLSQSVAVRPRSRIAQPSARVVLFPFPSLPPRFSLSRRPARAAMAEPSAATQSPSVSSSSSSSSGAESSALGGGSPGACPAPGAKSCGGSCAVHDLIFWRDAKKTGVVFGGTLVTLLSLAAFSVISVVSYLILALLSVTISFRVYKSVIQAVQKSEEGHPFKAYLDVDITLSSEAFHNYVNAAMVHINKTLKLVIRLFLVEDLVDSLKLAVFMWLMTYVGAVFNGITLLILAELLIFSVPIVYEKYKTQIDHYVSIVRDQTKSIVEKIQAKLPGIVKKKAE
ncbi:reticulon-3 isoform X1 [Erinaceus europaeus]|uniref:Reticulon n=1 Tax=Erinaceus europaeus TaxID=9365 RepID=A0A1S2ZFK2_ERIEU|nr:reticulon-3 isoform X1 [Erinaceus europaeus]